MKKFLFLLILIFSVHSVQAETKTETGTKTIGSFYELSRQEQRLAVDFFNFFYYGILYEKYKNPELAQEKFQSCQKNLSTVDMVLGLDMLYLKNKINKKDDVYKILYQIIYENCLSKNNSL